MENIFVGYDIGGTKTEIVFVQSDGKNHKVLSKQRLPTERDKGYEHILNILKKLFLTELKNQNLTYKEVKSIGFAMPGSVDPKTQQMTLGNTHVLENVPMQKDFLSLMRQEIPDFNIPLHSENDANCFALAEYHLGVGKNLSSEGKKPSALVGVILGTGVGGGIVINGKILQGRRGSGGEIGHTFLKKRDKECYCGQFDCVENFISGPGFESYYFEKTKEKKPLKEIFLEPSFKDIYKKDLARFLGQLTNVLDPDVFVLGGGISLEPSLYLGLQDLMLPHLFYKKDPPRVVQHAISDSAGGIGAALFNLDA